MLNVLELVAGGVLSLTTISSLIYFLWKGSVKVSEAFKTVEESSCKLSVLEKQILRSLQQIQQRFQVTETKIDNRLDNIEKKLTFLYGRTKTTIPPND
jgi:hypothetical protein